MERDFFMKTKRIGFSEWEAEDIELAKLLWGDSEVTRFICASGIFRQEEIENRLKSEIERNSIYHIQTVSTIFSIGRSLSSHRRN